ncbi:C2 NT-type domain-containing protein [Entamoeba marina]
MFSRKKSRSKFEFHVKINQVTNLKKLNGEAVFLTWKRGSREKSGTLQRALVINDCAVWGCSFKFASKFDQDEDKAPQFKRKNLNITLIQCLTGKTNGKTIAKVTINLSNYVDKPNQSIEIPFDEGTCSNCYLSLTFTCIPLVLDGHKVTKVASGKVPDKRFATAMIDGETYQVNDDKCDMSEMTIDSLSDDGDDEDTEVDESDPSKLPMNYQILKRQCLDLQEQTYDQLELINVLQLRIKELERDVSNPRTTPSQQATVTVALDDNENTDLQFITSTIFTSQLFYSDNGIPLTAQSIIQYFNSTNVLTENRNDFVTQLIQSITTVCQIGSSSNSHLSYWLSTICHIIKDLNQQMSNEQEEQNEEHKDIITDWLPLITKIFRLLTDKIRTVVQPKIRAFFFDDDGVDAGNITTNTVFEPLSNTLISLNTANVPVGVIDTFIDHFITYVDHFVFNLILRHAIEYTVETGFLLKLRISAFEEWIRSIKNICIAPIKNKFILLQDTALVMIIEKENLCVSGVLSEICPTITKAHITHFLNHFNPKIQNEIMLKLSGVIDGDEQMSEVDELQNVVLSNDFLGKIIL